MITYCKKCNKTKRSVKNPLCKACYINKNFKVWDGHTEESLKELASRTKEWIYKLEVTQRGWLDLYDINDIITYHSDIFQSDYVVDKLKAGEQLAKMWNDVKKFVVNYYKETKI